MSPAGPNYAGSVADGGGGSNVWTSPGNAAGVADGVFASVSPTSGTIDYLNATNFGFNIPAAATIDGIYVEFDRKSDIGTGSTFNVSLMKAGSRVGTPKSGTDIWPTTEAWIGYGGSTDLWGLSWTPADINNSGFGFAVQASFTHGTGTNYIDSMRVTVYWHVGALAANLNMPKHYIYKVYSASGQYLGNLPNVISDFGFPQDINTGGSQITVQCAVATDTSLLSPSSLTDESGNVLTDEAGSTLTDEGGTPAVGIGTSSALIRNGNRVVVWEYGYYHPNGVAMFAGKIKRWEANFGGEGQDETIRVYLYSDGNDMAHHLVRGNPYTYTLDQNQNSENNYGTLSQSSNDKGGGWSYYGQTFTVGSGVTNLAAIDLWIYGTATVTVTVYASPTSNTPLGSTTQNVTTNGSTQIQFAFPNPIPVTAGTQYFFTVTINAGQSATIYYSSSNPYSGGQMYTNVFNGASGGGWVPQSGADLEFQTNSGSGSTVATYSNVDPTTGMLEPILNSYNQEGGLVTYTSSSIQATRLSVTAGFNVNTVYEAVQEALTLSPSGFYFYVDLGTSVLTFKQASTTADVLLVKGKHLSQITIAASIEYLVNMAYFTGGKNTGGSTIYTLDSDASSISLYGQSLDRPSDTHVTDTATAHIVGSSEVASKKKEAYLTTVTIVDKTMDITTIKPGLIVGFRGFGTFVDSLLAQIVHIDYQPNQVTIQLGLLPRRLTNRVEQVTKGLIALNTINNPSSPS